MPAFDKNTMIKIKKFFQDLLTRLNGIHPQKLILRAIYLCALCGAVFMIAGAMFMRYILSDLPSIDHLDEYTPSLKTEVYDINNNLIANFSVENRAVLPLSEIPKNIQNAVIAMEDQKFYSHCGISLRGIMRSLLNDVLHRRRAQGGSTITQQLARGIFLTSEKTITRKVREIIIALQIEENFSKEEILTLYLNQIYLGGGVYGVQSAANMYFGKDVADLTLGECALLTGLIPSPERYSPFNHKDLAEQRRNLVLRQMVGMKYITKTQAEEAMKEPVPDKKYERVAGHGAYFVEYIRQQLEPKYGVTQLWKGGMKIYTTLDLRMQIPAETVMDQELGAIDKKVRDSYAASHKSEAGVSPSTAAVSLPELQGAFVILDNKTGGIRAMVGGRDFRESKFNRVVQAARQPGSTFKPFVWMAALQRGFTPASMVDDSPMAYYYDGKDWRLLEGATDQASIDLATQPFIGNKDFQIWVPKDFDGKTRGRITMRQALEKSVNLASVYLVQHVGATMVADVAHRAGIKKTLAAVPSIGLGTSLVSPLEMANAFSTFANGGVHVEPMSIVKVLDHQDRVLEENFPEETEAFPQDVSYVLVNMMQGVVQHGTGHRAAALKRPIAGKTGTSQEAKDMWFIGMTPDITAAAWMGYDDFMSLTMDDWTGGGTVLPWWVKIMTEVFKDQPVRNFPRPMGVVDVPIDQESGKLSLPTCPRNNIIIETFVAGTEPKEFCDIEH